MNRRLLSLPAIRCFAGLLLLVLMSRSSWVLAQEDADTAADSRASVPASADQQKTLAEIKDIFADDYAKAKKPEDKGTLARTLLKQIDDQKDDEIARFVLLKEAQRLAMDGGDTETAFACIELLGKEFRVDAIALLHEALDDLSKKAKTSQALKALNEANKAAIDRAIAADKFQLATKFCLIGDRLALAAKDPLERKRYLDTKTAVAAQQKEFEAAERAKEVLATKPDDPSANFDRGVYLLTRKQEWDAGLGHLVKCGDSELRALAKLELENPESTKARLELAEGWFDWTLPMKKTKPIWSKALAKYRYEQVASEVSGLDKTKVEKKLKEIGELDLKRGTDGVRVAKKEAEPVPVPKGTIVRPANPNNVGGPMNAALAKDQAKLTMALAEWLIQSANSSGMYRTANSSRSFTKNGPIPNEPFRITQVTFNNATADDFKLLDGLATIETCIISGGGTDGIALRALATSASVRGLHVINQVSLSEDYAPDLAKLKSLDNFFYRGSSPLGPKVLKALASLPELRTITIMVSPDVDVRDLESFRSSKISNATVNNADAKQIAAIASSKTLTQLTIEDSVLTDDVLAKLASPQMTSLMLSRVREVTGSGLAAWQRVPITSLRVSDCNAFDSKGLDAIYGMQSLTFLTLYRVNASLDLKRLKSASVLKSLELSATEVQDWGSLKNCLSLGSIRFGDFKLPAGVIKDIAKLPLSRVDLNAVGLTDDDLKLFSGHKTLQLLAVFNNGISQKAVDDFKAANPRIQVIR